MREIPVYYYTVNTKTNHKVKKESMCKTVVTAYYCLYKKKGIEMCVYAYVGTDSYAQIYICT